MQKKSGSGRFDRSQKDVSRETFGRFDRSQKAKKQIKEGRTVRPFAKVEKMMKLDKQFNEYVSNIDRADLAVSDSKKTIAINVGKLATIFDSWNELEKRYESLNDCLDSLFMWSKTQRNVYIRVGKFLLTDDNISKYNEYSFTQLAEIASIPAKDRDRVMSQVTACTPAKDIRAIKNEGKAPAKKKASKADVKQALTEMLALDDIEVVKAKIKNLLADM
jgi:hypothetical protein